MNRTGRWGSTTWLCATAPLRLARYYVRWGLVGNTLRVLPLTAQQASHWWAKLDRLLVRGLPPDTRRLQYFLFALPPQLGLFEPKKLVAGELVMPWSAIAPVRELVSQHGEGARQHGAPSPLRQKLQLWSLTVDHPQSLGGPDSPLLYYAHHLWQPGDAQSAGKLFGSSFCGLGASLGMEVFAEMPPALDKTAFEKFCRAFDIPHVETIAVVRADGNVEWSRTPEELPPEDLFVKPQSLSGGVGTMLLRFEDGVWWSGRGKRLGPSKVFEFLQRLAETAGPYLIQPRLRNHSGLSDLSGSALATVRVISHLNERDGFAQVFSFVRLGRSGAHVDNVRQGGLAGVIDQRTGTITSLRALRSAPYAESQHHPDTGARVVGRVLPNWPEVRALVERAHHAVKWEILGWDVAITENGPLLIEVNTFVTGSDLQSLQAPLSDGELGQRMLRGLDAKRFRRGWGFKKSNGAG